MDKRELAYTKQTMLNVKDWDGFQEVLRYYARITRVPAGIREASGNKKN